MSAASSPPTPVDPEELRATLVHLVRSEIEDSPGYEWIPRARLARVLDELERQPIAYLLRVSRARRWRELKPGVIVRGRFEFIGESG